MFSSLSKQFEKLFVAKFFNNKLDIIIIRIEYNTNSLARVTFKSFTSIHIIHWTNG